MENNIVCNSYKKELQNRLKETKRKIKNAKGIEFAACCVGIDCLNHAIKICNQIQKDIKIAHKNFLSNKP
jgi:hypothetical protein